MTWDEPPEYQTDHESRYAAVIDELAGADWSTNVIAAERTSSLRRGHPMRRRVRTRAPVATSPRRSARRRGLGRPPALRLRSEVDEYTVTDVLLGDYTGVVDDFVLRRGDGVPAYNLAVVVDDAAQGVDQVVRGDDLLSSSPRQAYLASLLGHPAPTYAHVPLVLNAEGKRLAKRDGAVTLPEIGMPTALTQIAESLGMRAATIDELLVGFDPTRLPTEPWTYRPD